LQNQTPFEMFYDKPLTFLDLQIFDSSCHVSTLEQHRTKIDPRAPKCIFLGFKFVQKVMLSLIYLLDKFSLQEILFF